MKRTEDLEMPLHRSVDRTQLITIGDLQDFKADFFRELKEILSSRNDNTEKQWLRSPEVRRMLGISPGTLQNLRINGALSFSKIGGIVFYKYEDIARLLESAKKDSAK